MKKMLMVSNGEHLVARIIKTTSLLLIALALGMAFWVASTPSAQAQGKSAAEMIASQLPQGVSAQSASKADYLSAVCAAVKKFKSAAPQIVRAASETHPAWKKDILRTAFQCLGTDDCRLLDRVLHAAISANPNDASSLTDVAVDAAPNCSGSFGPGPGREEGPGNYGNAPSNVNPPPGSIGGGGGQGNVVVVCFKGQSLFVTPERAQELVKEGATVGACQVTASVNQ